MTTIPSELPFETDGARLIYVIGASGAGKDTLLQGVRRTLHGEPIIFAKRFITRRPSNVGEQHLAISRERFDKLSESNYFVMEWHSHGFSYGIGRGIVDVLQYGSVVVVNGSREYLPEAIKRFPALTPILVEVDPRVLRARLEARGREDAEAITKRIERAVRPFEYPDNIIRIDNSASIKVATDKLLEVILKVQAL
ncbi:MAG: phosphonate metabolism protein/1,5-bisphosphokinase (PRPP-forming) PhnN [Pseudomonadota bacterium]